MPYLKMSEVVRDQIWPRNEASKSKVRLPALPDAAVPARDGGHAVLGARVVALVADVV